MPFSAEAITLTTEERVELEQMTQSRTLPAGDVFRARLILMLAEGVPYRIIQERLDTTAPTISRWKERFLQQRMDGLTEIRHPGQQPSVITPAATRWVSWSRQTSAAICPWEACPWGNNKGTTLMGRPTVRA